MQFFKIPLLQRTVFTCTVFFASDLRGFLSQLKQGETNFRTRLLFSGTSPMWRKSWLGYEIRNRSSSLMILGAPSLVRDKLKYRFSRTLNVEFWSCFLTCFSCRSSKSHQETRGSGCRDHGAWTADKHRHVHRWPVNWAWALRRGRNRGSVCWLAREMGRANKLIGNTSAELAGIPEGAAG